MALVDASIFIDNNTEQVKKYACPRCNYLLKDAVQTSCGHWLCHGCAEQLFKESSSPVCPRPECGEQLTSDDGKPFFPDKFVRKEIGKFSVKCPNHKEGCSWGSTYSELIKHIAECLYEVKACQHCGNKIPVAEYDDHLYDCPKAVRSCPFKNFGCKSNEKFTGRDLEKHITGDGLLQHLLLIAEYNGGKVGIDGMEDIIPLAKKASERVMFDGIPADTHSKSNKRDVETDGPRLDTQQPHLSQSDINSILHSVATKYELDQLRSLLTQKDTTIRNLEDKVACLEATIQAKATENEDRDFRLSLMENSNYDGTMLWKIPQFSQRMEDARTGKYTSIFSLPFNSGRYGYKMCLRLYILGDGIGKGTHMSLFFVVMKGEFDNILQWPFTHKVTFKLINQCGGRDVVDIFQPDPLSSSFQKPKTDMNVASGCPRFISLSELMQGGFIVDDTVFIKVKVDTTNMRHP